MAIRISVPNTGRRIPSLPYSTSEVDATAHGGSYALNATFESKVTSNGSSTVENEHLLQSVHNYEVLACANPVVLPFADPNAFSFYQDAGSLVAPFFFKDTRNPNVGSTGFSHELTFFVQPSLTETTKLSNGTAGPLRRRSRPTVGRIQTCLKRSKSLPRYPLQAPHP